MEHTVKFQAFMRNLASWNKVLDFVKYLKFGMLCNNITVTILQLLFSKALTNHVNVGIHELASIYWLSHCNK
jgi:hypothetical protein